MEYIRAGLVAAIVGAVIGAVAGMLVGLYAAPHAWAMLSMAVLWARDGTVAGATVGAIIGTANWMLNKRTIIQKSIGKLSGMASRKTVKVLVGTVAGVYLGGGVGAFIEIIIGVEKIRPFPNGMLLVPSGVMYIATAIGVIVGMMGGILDKVSDKTVRRVLSGMISGVVIGIAIGILLGIVTTVNFSLNFSMDDFIPALVGVIYSTAILTIPIAVFGIPVVVISETVVERLFLDIPVALDSSD